MKSNQPGNPFKKVKALAKIVKDPLAIPFKASKTSLDLPKSLQFGEWEELGRHLQSMEGSVMWWVGDWWRFGERYGKRVEIAMDNENYSYQTFRDAGWVAGRIEVSRRLDSLSWSHHQAVAGLEPKEQDRFLNKAIKESWSRNELRRAVKDHQLGVVRQKLSLAATVSGKFPVVYADPGWSYRNSGFESSSESHYLVMETEEICALATELEPLLMEPAVLFLWVTNPLLKDASSVIEAWGFEYKSNLVWVKNRPIGMGFYFRGQHELLLVATRGSFVPENELPPSVFNSPISKHSEKPKAIYELIEKMYTRGPYLELFLRGKERPGWTGFGNQKK